MVFTRFWVHCLLWPWPSTLWPQKLISISVSQIHLWPKFGRHSVYWFLRYGVHKVFGSLPAVTLTFDLWRQNLISTSTKPNTSVTKIMWNSWFLRYGVHKVYVTHRLTHSGTHSQTDRREYSMPPVPFFNGGGGRTKLHSCKQRCADADILASASVRVRRFCVRVRKNQSISVRVRPCLWMGEGPEGNGC